MPQHDRIDSLRGRTVRWTFADGPSAGTTYEHVFNEDGTIGFRGADKSGRGKFTLAREGTVEKFGDGIFVVSYLAVGGFTLTVVMNMRDRKMIGFASNNDSWFKQQGTFELVD